MVATDSDRSVEQQLRELTITNELIRSLTSTRDLPAVLRLVLDRLKMLTQAEGLSLLLYDRERDELVFSVAETLQENTLTGTRIPSGQGAAWWVLANGRSVLRNEPFDDQPLGSVMDGTSGFVTRSLMAVPLRVDGHVRGVIEVVNRYDGLRFAPEDLHRLESVSIAAGELRAPPAEGTDPTALRPLMTRIAAAVPAEGVLLLDHDPTRGGLVIRASRIVQDGLVSGVRLRGDQGIAGWVARHREPLRLDDVTSDPRYYRGFESRTRLIPRTMLCVPIVGQNILLGVIQVINKVDGSSFTDHDLRLAQTLADHAALAIENASLYRQAQEASITDDLTGLANTRYFNQVFQQILSSRARVSLLVLDLDNFKAVVDTHGHLAGSRTIRQLGRMVGCLVRSGDIAARFGGDEFVIILPDTDPVAAAALAEVLRAAIEATQCLEDGGIDISSVTASVGVASYPDHATTAEELFKSADAAMYRVKRARKNAVAVAEAR